ncbi:integrase catalytic domain-containing protein [Trichonephila clavipes]|nr:integrase catalytic domain-containing protein [Trichonephila clavipes]
MCSRIETKTLGVSWKSQDDCFIFKIAVELKDSCTKRCVLSTIAGLSDPLELLGPVVARAKIFMQSLWSLKIDWIDELSSERAKEWHRFLEDFNSVRSICIGRCIVHPQETRVELHGFADASEKCYGAVIYCCSQSPDGATTVKLVTSKSRVAPAWIQKEPNLLKTFGANRVATIQQLTNAEQWHHVSSEQNPADLVSTGLDPSSLHNSVWWNRPTFLTSKDFPERENAMAKAFSVFVRNNISKRWNTTENDVSKNQSSADSAIRLLNTGANAELKRLYKLVINLDPEMAGSLVDENINWKFLPPRAPNYDGLWKAGIKLFKFHFKRGTGNSRFTYEEFLTIMTQIEGILNSRPLIPLSR